MQTKTMTSDLLLIVTAFFSALLAGLFYGYTCSVNPGLGQLNDLAYLNAMQSINKAILNPLFFASFMGSLILIPLCAYLHYKTGVSRYFVLLATASLIYIIGVFGVTIAGNVPLNEKLSGLDLSSLTINELQQVRLAFEKPWLKLHDIRTIASVVCLTLILFALLFKNRSE